MQKQPHAKGAKAAKAGQNAEHWVALPESLFRDGFIRSEISIRFAAFAPFA
jgi:hypothetical protein